MMVTLLNFAGNQAEAQSQKPQQARLGQEEAIRRGQCGRVVFATGGRRGEGEAPLWGNPAADEQEKVILRQILAPVIKVSTISGSILRQSRMNHAI